MRIRCLTLCVRDKSDLNQFKRLKDFGLHVEIMDSGSANGHGGYYVLFVSDEKIPKSLLDELIEYPPGSFDWSDSEHNIK